MKNRETIQRGYIEREELRRVETLDRINRHLQKKASLFFHHPALQNRDGLIVDQLAETLNTLTPVKQQTEFKELAEKISDGITGLHHFENGDFSPNVHTKAAGYIGFNLRFMSDFIRAHLDDFPFNQQFIVQNAGKEIDLISRHITDLHLDKRALTSAGYSR